MGLKAVKDLEHLQASKMGLGVIDESWVQISSNKNHSGRDRRKH